MFYDTEMGYCYKMKWGGDTNLIYFNIANTLEVLCSRESIYDASVMKKFLWK
jgi:hypothetical protein